MLLPKRDSQMTCGAEPTSEANSAAYTGECPNCERKADWTGEKKVEDGRDYVGMKCSHCFNLYWLYNSDTAGL